MCCMKSNTRDIDRLPTRREALVGMMAVAAAMGSVAFATETPQRSRLGLVAYNCAFRRKWMQQRDPKFDLFEPLAFLKHCHGVGAGGMQTSLGVLDAARVKSLRDFADEQKLFARQMEVLPGRACAAFLHGLEKLDLGRGGIPSVVFGPGDIAQAHTADEWIAVEQLELGVIAYRAFMEAS